MTHTDDGSLSLKEREEIEKERSKRQALMERKADSLKYHLRLLNPFLYEDDEITEIAINRPYEIWVEKNGDWIRHENNALDYHLCRAIGIAAAKYSDNEFSDTTPILSSVLPNKERAQFLMSPACEQDTISITIRKPSKKIITLDQYRSGGFFNRVLPSNAGLSEQDIELKTLLKERRFEEFLIKAVHYEKNIIVAGATGSGKTTFMKTLMQEIPTHERILTIEDVAELFLPNHPNHVHMFYPSETKENSIVTPASLLKSCLRMKPDRILLAELRGSEAWDYIQICSSGHGGSITSLHAGNVNEVFERLTGMYRSNPKGQNVSDDVIMRSLHMTIDVVVHMDNIHGFGRGITQVWFEPELKLQNHHSTEGKENEQ